MTSPEIPPTSYVGVQLEGTHNYSQWLRQLEIDLCATTPMCWLILIGADEGPIEPKYEHYTYEQAVALIACSKGIDLAQVSNEQVESFFRQTPQQNRLLSSKYDTQTEEWEKLNNGLRLQFGSTLGEVPACHVRYVFGARAAFLVIEDLYAGTTGMSVQHSLTEVSMPLSVYSNPEAASQTGCAVTLHAKPSRCVQAIDKCTRLTSFSQSLDLESNIGKLRTRLHADGLVTRRPVKRRTCSFP